MKEKKNILLGRLLQSENKVPVQVTMLPKDPKKASKWTCWELPVNKDAGKVDAEPQQTTMIR